MAAFHITTALLWATSGEDQPDRQFEPAETHVLDLHCDRLLAAAQAFSWSAVLNAFEGEHGHKQFQALLLKHIPSAISQSKCISNKWKVRVLVGEDANTQLMVSPVALSPVNGMPQWPHLPEKLHSAILSTEACKLVVDIQPTLRSALTTHKTTHRRQYDEARSRLGIEHIAPTESEVLLFNEDREVMEASLCTPYFFRNGIWVTPALSSGGNAGVSRRLALEAGLCIEKTLYIDDLLGGEIIWLSNAVRGFIPGTLRLLTE